ncbi:EspA/EspE family type VII secretion system effector [Mycolicibacterium aubagnense]|uniref:ESX-1 secretion-associated protein EspA/EspE-like domain-containing protein n=1 Tax=Mycolicibacterium aubagnense TaxID=319707 RepID=A0ABM7IH98_9MYCO|nr:EspA/EspE family type VII secretion system effector [Mycolicibacterium aubagnense]WGI32322.1 EspA/EspE family type VII secretion system effector [Mycolicibacterium aubagnense]BBX86111.1 hypothetical protein MAUB_39840 [Mycolicibacterium aubagnense]
MSFESVVHGAIEFVEDAAKTVKNAAKAVEKIAEKAGLPKIAGIAKSVGKYAGKLVIAPTPVLKGGQEIVKQMRRCSGEGDPDVGDDFRQGRRGFQKVQDTLTKAHPSESWDGGPAPRAYDNRVQSQEKSTAILMDADDQVATTLSREADEINEVRRKLDGQHNWLADYGKFTQSFGVIPVVGKEIQYVLETLAVSFVLTDAGHIMWDMHNNANSNAAAVRKTHDLYQTAASNATQSDSVNDFDPRSSSAEQRVIVPAAIRALAGVQGIAEKNAAESAAATTGASAKVGRTHGFICAVTHKAVTEAEAERATAGKNLAGVCKELGGKLQHAAGRYEQADAEGKANLDKQMPPR